MRRPKLIIVDRFDRLVSGTPYVLSFLEVTETVTVVRFLGLADGFVREILDLEPVLRDDTGHVYPLTATVSTGLLLPEEVLFGYQGAPAERVRMLKLLSADRRILQVVRLR